MPLRILLSLPLLLAACGTDEASDQPALPSQAARSPAAGESAPPVDPAASAPATEATAAAAPDAAPAPQAPGAAPSPDAPAIPADTEIVTTASGLKYSILAPGDGGKSPQRGDPVTVHYSGWLEDGTLFDSSVQRGEPARFTVGQLIEGWNEGLTLMTRGSRFKFTIPAALGYQDRGQAPLIPPGATLIFEVELIDFAKLPQFHVARPELQKALPTGVKYEVLAQGAAEPPAPEHVLVLEYAVWNTEGQLLDCSQSRGGPVKTRLDALGTTAVPFLQEGAKLLTVGSRLRFDVPGEQTSSLPPEPGQPPHAALVWELELTGTIAPLAVPPFKASAPEALKTTASGLKYEVLQEGAGEPPTLGQKVQIHYVGWLAEGKKFDSSFERGEPFTLQVGRSIPGLVEGLLLMREGARYQFVIPPALGYGPQGAPPDIGPDAELVFYVELVDTDC